MIDHSFEIGCDDIASTVQYYEEGLSDMEERTLWNGDKQTLEYRVENAFSSLERAMDNANEAGFHAAPATPSRFALWSENMLWLLRSALSEQQAGREENAGRLMGVLEGNLCAFRDCSWLLDSTEGYMGFRDPTPILERNQEALNRTI